MKQYLPLVLLCVCLSNCSREENNLENDAIDAVHDASNFHEVNEKVSSIHKLIQTEDAQIVFIGNSQAEENSNYRNIGVGKVDQALSDKWFHEFDGIINATPNEIIELDNSQLLIAGSARGFNREAYFIQLEADGTTIRTTLTGEEDDETAESIIEIPNKEYIFCGRIGNASDNTQTDILVSRLDHLHRVIWSKRIESIGRDIPSKLIKTSDSTYVILAQAEINPITHPIQLISMTIDSAIIWRKTFNNVDILSFNNHNMVQTSDQGFALITNIDDGTDENVRIIKTDKDGNLEWLKDFGGDKTDFGIDLVQVDDGYLILGETSSFGNGSSDFMLIKTSDMGDQEWIKTYGSADIDIPSCLLQINSNEFWIGGTYVTAGKGIIFKVDKSGNPI